MPLVNLVALLEAMPDAELRVLDNAAHPVFTSDLLSSTGDERLPQTSQAAREEIVGGADGSKDCLERVEGGKQGR